jgi:hypothetical protein
MSPVSQPRARFSRKSLFFNKDEGYPDLDDWDDWKSRWLHFAESLPGVVEIPEEHAVDKYEEWIESAVEAFARQRSILRLFMNAWQTDGTR